MKLEKFEGKWEQLKEQVSAKWVALTPEDIDQISGNIEILMAKLSKHYGYNKVEAAQQLEGFVRDCTFKEDCEWRSAASREV